MPPNFTDGDADSGVDETLETAQPEPDTGRRESAPGKYREHEINVTDWKILRRPLICHNIVMIDPIVQVLRGGQ